MNWRISSFQELEHLSPTVRRQILRQCAGPWLIIRMIVRSVLLGVIPAITGFGVVVELWRPPAGSFGGTHETAILMLLWGLFSTMIYQFSLLRFRGQLLIYLEEAARKDRLPMCLKCGYSIEGLTGNVCPECGFLLGPGETTGRGSRQR